VSGREDIPHEPSASRRLARRAKPRSGDVVPLRSRPAPWTDEGPSPEDLARFSGVTQTCPECGAELHDDIELCWQCGHPLGSERSKGPKLWVLLAVAAVVAGLLIAVML